MRFLRSVAAVVGGFLATAVLVGVGTAIAVVAFSVPLEVPAGATVPAAYLAVNLLVSFLAAGVGGYVCGWIAPSRPFTHAAILAGLFGALSLLTAATTGAAPGQPAWYPWVIGLLGIAGVLSGGGLRSRRFPPA